MQDAEKILRSIPTTEKVFRSSRRVRSLTSADCILALSKHGYKTEEIKQVLQQLLASYKLVKVRPSERNPSSVDLIAGKTVGVSDIYIWAEEESNKMTILVGILTVAVALVLVMFQIWPIWLKRAASYSKYPIFAFMLFLVVMAVIRLVVFAITYLTSPPGLWILPNLFADCGFFESFVPLYSWSNQNVSHKKKQ